MAPRDESLRVGLRAGTNKTPKSARDKREGDGGKGKEGKAREEVDEREKGGRGREEKKEIRKIVRQRKSKKIEENRRKSTGKGRRGISPKCNNGGTLLVNSARNAK